MGAPCSRRSSGLAGKDSLPLHLGTDAPAGDHAEVLGLRQRPAVSPAAADDGLPQRMLRELLGGGRQPVELVLAAGFGHADHCHHLRRAVGQGAGLVEGDDLSLGQPLQGVALPDQEAVLRGVADGRHDGGGRGQHQGAGAEHHQDGDGPDDLAGDQPGEGRGAEGDDHDPGGPAVGETHDLGLAGVRRLHQADHPLDGAVLAHLGSLHLKGAELVHRAAGDRVAHGLVHRQGFAGHHRLVDGGLSRPR